MPLLRVNSYTSILGPKLGYGTTVRNWISSARIVCVCESGYTLNINFYRPENPVPAAFTTVLDRGYIINIFVPYDQYPYYMDMLRNESPVSAQIWTDIPEFCRLTTGAEDIGEGES